jgi:hypothetical protein
MRIRLLLLVFLAILAFPALTRACPMCSQNLNEEQHLPKAFLASILFMLAVPPTVLAGIAFAIWRARRKHALLQQAMESVGES